MSHSVIILDNKLDCIGANASLTDSARALKTAVHSADEAIDPNAVSSNPNIAEIHELLEEIQLRVTSLCDNGFGTMTEGEICNELDEYKSALESLL